MLVTKQPKQSCHIRSFMNDHAFMFEINCVIESGPLHVHILCSTTLMGSESTSR